MKKVIFSRRAAAAAGRFFCQAQQRGLLAPAHVAPGLTAVSKQVRQLAEERRRVRDIDQDIKAQRVSI